MVISTPAQSAKSASVGIDRLRHEDGPSLATCGAYARNARDHLAQTLDDYVLRAVGRKHVKGRGLGENLALWERLKSDGRVIAARQQHVAETAVSVCPKA